MPLDRDSELKTELPEDDSTQDSGESKRPKPGNSRGFGAEKTEEAEEKSSIATIRFEDLKIVETEYQEVPDRLPHGIWCHGERVVDFEIAPYSAEVDLAIGKLYNGQRPDLKTIVTQALPQQLKSIGGMSPAKFAAECSVTVNQLFEQMVLADAITMALAAKTHLTGWEIAIEDTCPNCRTRHKDDPKTGTPYHDIGCVKTGTIENYLSDRLVVEIELERGFLLHDERVKRIQLRPIRLYELTPLQKMERGTMDIKMAQMQVCGVPESSRQNVRGTILTDRAIVSMEGDVGLRDRSLLLKASQELSKIGPQMSLGVTCNNCGTEWDSQLNWVALRQFWFTVLD